ncbi:MAG TPA: SUMF1/EgtB/PvdO family nonheme iron enzyme, partial [Polyangium sp.]|nr:SUMF1/EgtB/PvdO family nonheme iron enzyme [Polyangium sp.]
IGICSPGQKGCNGNTVEVCNGGQWQFEASCPGQTCADGACVGVCEPGTRCAGETVQSCDAMGQWQDVKVCSLPVYCAGGACIEACVAGDLRCQGNASNVCVDGVWQEKQACTGQTCVMTTGSCAGVCMPSDARCVGQTPEACDVNGSWKTLPACAGVCSSGSCPGPSCAGLPETCGPNKNENCCASRIVPAMSYQRGDDVAFPATVSEYRLDRFEVTVGRFRKFVEEYSGPTLAEGAGAHPKIAGSGWKATWNQKLPPTFTDLKFSLQCSPEYQTFTNAPGPNEDLPVNCVNWYVAFAFCIWDGGRLPTEAEWHAAASGGSEQRRFPWSNPPESTKNDGSFAVYECTGDGSPASVCSFSDIRPPGSRSPRGDGKFGHADLAGNIWEWLLDSYASTYPTPCIDCAFLGDEATRVLRGGAFSSSASSLRNITRGSFAPISNALAVANYGIRCARMP